MQVFLSGDTSLVNVVLAGVWLWVFAPLLHPLAVQQHGQPN